MVLRVRKFKNGIFLNWEGQSHPYGFIDTPLHVNTARDVSKLPWHKYLKGHLSKNHQPLNPSASLSPAADYMKYGIEFMAGLCTWLKFLKEVIYM